MSSTMNKVMLMGFLGADPELKFAETENPCLNFRIATTERWKDKQDQLQERTEWHTIEMWGSRAKGLSTVLAKGMLVMVDGSIRSRTVEGENLQKRKFVDIRAKDIVPLRWPRNAAEQRFDADGSGDYGHGRAVEHAAAN